MNSAVNDRPDVSPELELHKVVSAGPCGVSMMDSEGRFEFVNEALAQGLGYGAGDLVGKSWIDLVYVRDRLAVIEAVDSLHVTGKQRVQCRLTHRNGHECAVELLFSTRKGATNTDSGLFCFCKPLETPALTLS